MGATFDSDIYAWYKAGQNLTVRRRYDKVNTMLITLSDTKAAALQEKTRNAATKQDI